MRMIGSAEHILVRNPRLRSKGKSLALFAIHSASAAVGFMGCTKTGSMRLLIIHVLVCGIVSGGDGQSGKAVAR